MYEYEEAISYYEEVKKAKPELVTQLDFIESMGCLLYTSPSPRDS